MLKCVRRENADDAIRAGAVESAFLRGTAERARYLDIHPFEEFARLIENVDVPIGGQDEYFDTLNGDADEDLHLDLAQVGGLGLNDGRGFIIGFPGIWQTCFLIQVPVLQMSVARRDEVVLVGRDFNVHRGLR